MSDFQDDGAGAATDVPSGRSAAVGDQLGLDREAYAEALQAALEQAALGAGALCTALHRGRPARVIRHYLHRARGGATEALRLLAALPDDAYDDELRITDDRIGAQVAVLLDLPRQPWRVTRDEDVASPPRDVAR